MSSVNFYKASNLPQSMIDNIDQRVTVDIERFCDDLSNLYSSLFKPVLDIVLNTVRLSAVMGTKQPSKLNQRQHHMQTNKNQSSKTSTVCHLF